MNRAVILAVVLFLALPAAHAIINTTGTITLDNVNGQLTAGVQPSTGISVTFEQAASASGGDGGGGGADTTGPLDPSTTHLYDVMEPDKEYTFRSPGEPYVIRAITFHVLANKTQVLFRLTHILNITRETVPPLGPGYEVFGYERFDYTGLFEDEVAHGVRIRWGVPLSMLAARELSTTDVGLYRYDGANWALLNSTILETNESDLALYEALSPGLSYFAVAHRLPSSAPSSETSPGNGVTGDVTGSTTSLDASGITGTGSPSTTVREEDEEPVAPAKKGKGFPFLSILVIFVIGGAIIGYYYYDSRQKVAAVNAQALKPRPDEPLIGFASIEEDAFQDPVERLRAYVDKELRQGFRREAIASQLRKSGWPENIITNVLDNFSKEYLQRRGMHEPHEDYEQVLAFLKEKLDLGYDVNVIRRSLVKTGWDANLIDSLLGEIHQEAAKEISAYTDEALARLRGFISNELKKGYSRAQIRGALLKAGWQAKVVDEELARK